MDQSHFFPENDNADLALSFMEYVYLLWRWIWLILAVGLLAGGMVFFITNRTPPPTRPIQSSLSALPITAITGPAACSSSIT